MNKKDVSDCRYIEYIKFDFGNQKLEKNIL